MSRRPHATRPFPALLNLLVATLALPAAAQQVACHYTYGGETKTLTARPADSPYRVPAIEIGSYFQFRVVVQTRPRDIAAIKVYTYANGEADEGPVLIHQATYAYPPRPGGDARYGFSGLQFVYETTRDGELQYWCELAGPGAARSRR